MPTKVVKKKTAKKKTTRRKKDEPSYKLPTKKRKPSSNMLDYVWLIFGEKKIGKTSLANMFGDQPFFLMFEPGDRALELYSEQLSDDRAGWVKFRQVVRALEKDKKFGPPVVDTVDLMYLSAMSYVCHDLGIDHPQDLPFGKGWNAVKREFSTWVYRLIRMGKGAVFLSHDALREIETRQFGKLDRVVPTFSNQCSDVMDAVVDVWANYYYNLEERRIKLLGDESVSAGHRLKGRMLYTDGTPVRDVSAGSSEEEAFEQLSLAFNNQLERPEEPTKKKRTTRKKRSTKKRTVRRR